MPEFATIPLKLGSPEPSERLTGLADRLCALLERRGRPLEVGQIVQQVLRVKGAPERLQRLLVAEIVDTDHRLGWRARDLVGLQTPSWSTATLENASFCVVDLETTGGRPGSAKITEIGAVRIEGLTIVDRFEQLVDPEVPIPAMITSLTGIDARMVAGQPRIGEALERFMAFSRGDVLVAHNAAFDLRFLNYERQRLGRGHFSQPALDTLSLARRLLRGEMKRFDLDSLSRWAMTRVRPCHRALADAEATGELLAMMLAMLVERGEGTVADALRFSRPYSNRNAHKLALTEELPSTPGIYLMRGRDGTLLYVGRAANLRRRVRSYFGPQGRHASQIGGVLDRLATIDHEVCGTEFEASLRECNLLAELRPPGNRHGVSQHARRYLKLTVAEGYPRLYVVARPGTDDAHYFGPLASRKGATLALEALHLIFPLRSCHPCCRLGVPGTQRFECACGGPCSGTSPEDYRVVIGRLERALTGDSVGLSELATAVRNASLQGRFQPAGRDRERMAALLGALARLARLGRASDDHAIVVEPGADGTPVAFFVAHGLVVHRGSLDDNGSLARGITAMRAVTSHRPVGAVEESNLVRAHLALRDGSPGIIRLFAGWSDASAWEWLERAMDVGTAAEAA